MQPEPEPGKLPQWHSPYDPANYPPRASHHRVPVFGHTRHGHHPVHAHIHDYHRTDTRYQRFNLRAAVWMTNNVGTMTAFWVFTALSMCVAPSCLYAAGYIHLKVFITTFGFNLLATLILSTWLELALMPCVMVIQNMQSKAADARTTKMMENDELIADRLDCSTEGGIKTILDALDALAGRQDEGPTK
ncbi:MAG: hypothetical protein ACLP50_27460 [Solirubrobacteraceae bacterium]